ncbi:MAG TPA: DNA glycosylase [Nitrososphaerales archaeon]|nr:DNA glycosylase [Nitrososphaerales archaeon]
MEGAAGVGVAAMEFTLNIPNTPFDLSHTLDSGQAFRWTQQGGWWQGYIQGEMVRVRQEGDSLFCVSGDEHLTPEAVHEYFRLDDGIERIYSKIMKDDHITEAIQRYYGLHLIHQEVWECLISFVIATNTNIPRIRLMISNLCQRFGKRETFEGSGYSVFPRPEPLADASVEELASCGLGYRARFVKSVAEKVQSGTVDLEELKLADYQRAREMLVERLGEKTFLGIGPKAADCVLLFSCWKDEAFPIDVWMARVLARYYPGLFDKDVAKRLGAHVSNETRLSGGVYERISASMREYFGQYAGYAQQYLFHDARKSGLD